MSQFEPYGFEDLRGYLQNNWQFIGIVDDTGTELVRIDVPNDSRASFTSGPTTNPLTAEITLTGQNLIDEGNTLPVTIVRTETFLSSSAATRTGYDPVKNATIEADQDEIIITHNYRMPP